MKYGVGEEVKGNLFCLWFTSRLYKNWPISISRGSGPTTYQRRLQIIGNTLTHARSLTHILSLTHTHTIYTVPSALG